MKKYFVLLLSFVLILSACGSQAKKEAPVATPSNGETKAEIAEVAPSPAETEKALGAKGEGDYKITLGEEVLVNGEAIEEISSHTVFLQKLVETHPDVPADYAATETQVITLAAAGSYHLSGTLANGQIRVDTESTEDITLVLDGVDITNHTGPGLYILNGQEKDTPGEGQVTVYLAEGSQNTINASHLGKVTLDSGEEIKNDGAVSSNQSFIIDGLGTLHITADKEGIESKRHLTINGGQLYIQAMDDSINASEDGVSHIIINDGFVSARSTLGTEGDGMDSNGNITINGGTVVAVGHPTSMDSGLDSDLGIRINGGTVAAVGQMYDEIVTDSQQQFIHLTFANSQPEGTLVVVTDEGDQPLAAYRSDTSFSNITLSSGKLQDGDCKVYVGGTIEGTENEGVYTDITAYEGGTQQQQTGTGGGGRPFGGGQPPNMTEGAPPEPPAGGAPPTGEAPPAGQGQAEAAAGEASTVFTLNKETHLYSGVSNAN